MKEYIPVIETPEANLLEVKTYYSLGGASFATYKNIPRGYYLSVTPVRQYEFDGVQMISFTAFTGVKQLILPCNRRSAKQETQAIALAREKQAEMIQHVLRENGLQLIKN